MLPPVLVSELPQLLLVCVLSAPSTVSRQNWPTPPAPMDKSPAPSSAPSSAHTGQKWSSAQTPISPFATSASPHPQQSRTSNIQKTSELLKEMEMSRPLARGSRRWPTVPTRCQFTTTSLGLHTSETAIGEKIQKICLWNKINIQLFVDFTRIA